jgi:hypothetical protein
LPLAVAVNVILGEVADEIVALPVAVAVPGCGELGGLVYEYVVCSGKFTEFEKEEVQSTAAHKSPLVKLYAGSVGSGLARAVPFDHKASKAAPAMRLIDFAFMLRPSQRAYSTTQTTIGRVSISLRH